MNEGGEVKINAIRVLLLTTVLITTVCLLFLEAQVQVLTTTLRTFTTSKAYYTKAELDSIITRITYDKNKREAALTQRVRWLEEKDGSTASLDTYARQISQRVVVLEQQIKEQQDMISKLRDEFDTYRATRPE